MKNKILIFIFCIITLGLFVIPISFAKSYRSTSLDYVNRVSHFNDNGGTIFWVHLDLSDIQFNGSYYHINIEMYNENGKRIDFTGVYWSNFVYTRNSNDTTIATNSYDNNTTIYINSSDLGTQNITSCYFGFGCSSTLYNFVHNGTYTFNAYCFRDNSSNLNLTRNAYFVPNNYYGLMSSYFGALNNLQVFLKLQGTSGSGTDISEKVLSFNSMRFSSDLITTISSNNDTNTYQYFIRVYFNQYIRDLVNFNLSYLEFSSMRLNNTTYSSYASSRNALPILYNNIVMYNDNSTLFTTNDLVNSGYGNSYLEYIDFNIANYTFKSSSYYNSNIGIQGYISNTSITAMSLDNNVVYNTGYENGYSSGDSDGYNRGYNDGVNSNRTSFDNLMLSVANVPMTIISSMLNFDVLGVNLLGFFMGIITLLLFVKLMRKFKE